MRAASIARLLVLAGFVALAAAPAQAGNVTAQPSGTGSPWTWTWPPDTGSSGYVLQTDGTGITSWVAPGSVAVTPALSSLLGATTTNSIDNSAWAQTWKWGTLSTQTALTLTTSSMTTGTLLNLSNSAAGSNAGTVLSVNNSETGAASYGINVTSATTGSGYGISSALSTVSNTGYAGYFINATTKAAYGVYSTMSASGNTGYAGYFSNAATGSNAGYGVYATMTTTSNVGAALSALNNSTSGWGVYAGGTSPNYFGGNVGIGTTSPAEILDVVGAAGAQARFMSTGSNNGEIIITNNAGGNQSTVLFQDIAASKWQLGKQTDNSFFAYDSVNSKNFLAVTTSGLMTLGENGQMVLTTTGSVGIGTTSPGALLDIGLAGTTTGTMRLEGKTSGYVQLQTANAAGSWTVTLPTSAGSSGYVLQTDGTGITSWVPAGGGGSAAISALLAATTTNSIDNTNWAQTWKWGTLSTQTALTLTTSSMTTGTLMSLTNAATGANPGTTLSVNNSEGAAASYGINVTSATTGSGYGVSSALSTASNTGYAGYFSNATTKAAYGVYSSMSAAGNTGYAGYFTNAATGSNAGYGVYATMTTTSNVGAALSALNNSTSGWSVYAGGTAPSYFAGSVGIGTSSASDKLDISGAIGLTATTGTLPTNGFYSPSAGQLAFTTTGIRALTITTTQSIGVGTTNPAATLHVNGGAIVANDTASCSATNAGEIKYTSNQLYFCSSTCWRPSYLTPNTTNLVSYWTLDASSGTLVADSAGSNTGTTHGSPTWSPAGGQVGGALSFASASSQYVEVPRAASLEPGAVTVAAWIYENGSQTQDAGLVLKNFKSGTTTPNESYMLQVSIPANEVEFDIGTSSGRTSVASSTISTGTWTHVVGTYDPKLGTMYLYINGAQNGSAAVSGAIDYDTASPSGDFYIATTASTVYGGAPIYFNGLIDDVRVYNSALSASQVQNLYLSGSAGCN